MPKYYPDKLLEVRPVSNAKKEHLQMIAPMVNLCIEKQMGPFQGRSKLKQYNPQKPKKQIVCLKTSPKGHIFKFEVHLGTIDVSPGKSLGMLSIFVINVCKYGVINLFMHNVKWPIII